MHVGALFLSWVLAGSVGRFWLQKSLWGLHFEGIWLQKVRKMSQKTHFLEKCRKCVWIGKYHTERRVGPLRIEVKIVKKVLKILSEFQRGIFSEKVCPEWGQELLGEPLGILWDPFGDHLGRL